MDDRYQVTQLTEELAFGKYYEAEDSFIQRKVEIFRFITPDAEDASEWKDVFGEASADLGTISHPGLPIIYEHGIDDEGPFSIRQKLDTTSLNARLVEGGQLSEYEGWELANQLLEIHDAAATSKNFHGALDPNHIGFLARPSGEKRYSITDYGLAEIHNRIHGTKQYFGINFLISPGQSKDGSTSERAQLYSIGQLIFHALCGGHPWTDVPVESIFDQPALEPISAYNPTIPEAMDKWLAKLIAVDPADRFSSYAEAFEQLPQPIQSAPVPINATGAVFSTPATAATAAQSVNATSAVPTVSVPASKPPHKNPIILGAAGLILLIIIIFAVSGGDDDDKTSGDSAETTTGDDQENGLVAYFDFESSSAQSSEGSSIKLNALKKSPQFSRKGCTKKSRTSLILDKDHIYRIPIIDTPLAERKSDYTISFWMLPTISDDTKVSVLSKQPWSKGSQPSGEDFQWTLDKSVIYGNSWNMITMVFTHSDEKVTVYLDGELAGASSTGEVSEQIASGFIYLGCDSNRKSVHKKQVLIDNLSLWNKRLSSREIQQLYDQ